jgi:hypothetical protein
MGQAGQEELLLACLTLEDGTDRFSRNVGTRTVILRCVKSQKSADLNSIMFSFNTIYVGLHRHHQVLEIKKTVWGKLVETQVIKVLLLYMKIGFKIASYKGKTVPVQAWTDP